MHDKPWSCSGKEVFDSYSHAAKRLRRPKKSPAAGRKASFSDCRLEPYRCRHCHQWHIGNSVHPDVSLVQRRRIRAKFGISENGSGHASARSGRRRYRRGVVEEVGADG